MAAINRDSFIEEYKASVSGFSTPVSFGTVEVTLGHTTKRLPARKWDDSERYLSGSIIVNDGISARYRTGSKNWNVTISSHKRDDKFLESVNYGRDDRSSKFKKAIVGFSA